MPFVHWVRRVCPIEAEVKTQDLNATTNTQKEDVCREHAILEVSTVYSENTFSCFQGICVAETAFQV